MIIITVDLYSEFLYQTFVRPLMERYRQLLKQEHGFRSVLSDRGYYAEEARTSLALCR